MIKLYKNIDEKYSEVANRLENVGKREAAQKEKFKSKMKNNFDALNQLADLNKEL